VEELEVELRRRRLRWFGHVARAEERSVLSLAEGCRWEGDVRLGDRRRLGGVFRRIWTFWGWRRGWLRIGRLEKIHQNIQPHSFGSE
jgi:hypothetical protein